MKRKLDLPTAEEYSDKAMKRFHEIQKLEQEADARRAEAERPKVLKQIKQGEAIIRHAIESERFNLGEAQLAMLKQEAIGELPLFMTTRPLLGTYFKMTSDVQKLLAGESLAKYEELYEIQRKRVAYVLASAACFVVDFLHMKEGDVHPALEEDLVSLGFRVTTYPFLKLESRA